MGTREREEQIEQEREQLELQRQEQERMLATPRGLPSDGDNETVNNPAIINK